MTVDDLYASDDLAWLAQRDEQVETDQVERKSALDKGVAEAISALANAQGGLVVVGVDRDGKPVGLEPAHLDGKLKEVLDRLETGANILETRKVSAGPREILLVRVPASTNRVCRLSDGSAFRRVGRNSVKLSGEDARELGYARGEQRFELEPATPYDRTLLSEELCAALQAVLLGGPRPLEQDLESLQLVVRRQGALHLTNAGLLVLAQNPARLLPGAEVRVLRFDGTEEKVGAQRNIIKDQTFGGPIPSQLTAAIEFLATQVREFNFRQADGTFSLLAEYPRRAWEEAVTNAVVHRSYSLTSTQTVVRLFDDRMTVTSPGGFFQTISEQQLQMGAPASAARNPVVMEALFRFRRVLRVSEGHRVMRSEMQARGLPPPSWHEDPEKRSVQVTLRNDYAQIKAIQAGNGHPEEWGAIAAGLGDPKFKPLRERAIYDLRNLAQTQKRVPEDVLAIAFRRVLEGGVDESAMNELVSTLTSLQLKSALSWMRPILNEILSGRFSQMPGVAARLRELAASAPDVVDDVVERLANPDFDLGAPAVDWCFQVLSERVGRYPVPERALLERIDALASSPRYADQPSAIQLLTRLRG